MEAEPTGCSHGLSIGPRDANVSLPSALHIPYKYCALQAPPRLCRPIPQVECNTRLSRTLRFVPCWGNRPRRYFLWCGGGVFLSPLDGLAELEVQTQVSVFVGLQHRSVVTHSDIQTCRCITVVPSTLLSAGSHAQARFECVIYPEHPKWVEEEMAPRRCGVLEYSFPVAVFLTRCNVQVFL